MYTKMFLRSGLIILSFYLDKVRLMNVAYTAYTGNSTVPRVYSPVTLSNEWPKVERLVFMVIFACAGTTMNGFFVASFFVEEALRRVGNVFLACVGMADLVMTTGVLPIAAVVLLSGEWDSVQVCHTLQYMTESATYCYTLFFMLASGETYYRIKRSPPEYHMFMSMHVGLVSITVFTVGFGVAAFGVFYKLDYDYCERLHYGNFYFRVTTTVVLHVIPAILTFYCFICASRKIKNKAYIHPLYKRSQQYERDNSLININITAFILYVIGWLPYLVIIHEYPATTDNKFYHCAWIGVCRSVVSTFLYSTANRNFRRAFAHLFNYCCCKSTLSGSFNHRHRRVLEYKPADVRVHIMHQAVNSNSNQRGASSSRETQEL